MNENCSSPGSDSAVQTSRPSSPQPLTALSSERLGPLKKRRFPLENSDKQTTENSSLRQPAEVSDSPPMLLTPAEVIGETGNEGDDERDRTEDKDETESDDNIKTPLKQSPARPNVNDAHLSFLTSKFGGSSNTFEENPATPTLDERETPPEGNTPERSTIEPDRTRFVKIKFCKGSLLKKFDANTNRSEGKRTLSLEAYKTRKKQQGIALKTEKQEKKPAPLEESSTKSPSSSLPPPPTLFNMDDDAPPPPPPPRRKELTLEPLPMFSKPESTQLSLNERLKKCFGVDVEADGMSSNKLV